MIPTTCIDVEASYRREDYSFQKRTIRFQKPEPIRRTRSLARDNFNTTAMVIGDLVATIIINRSIVILFFDEKNIQDLYRRTVAES